MSKNDIVYIQHILSEIKKIEDSTKGVSESGFNKNVDIQDATLRRIEIIGEAVKNISPELKQKYPNIEWKKIAGTRDVLIHAYFSIEMSLIWQIVKKNLPIFKTKLEKIVKTST